MKVLVLFALLIASSYCVGFKNLAKANSKVANQLKELQATKFGKMIYTLVEVHMATNGPVEELQQEIDNLIEALQQQGDDETVAWETTTKDHEGRNVQYAASLQEAEASVQILTQQLNAVLEPLFQTLSQSRDDLTSQISSTQDQLTQGQSQRESDDAVFTLLESDSNDAIDALNEAVSFVSQLQNQAPSLIQIRQVKTTMTALSSKKLLKNNVYTPLIKALISLSQNFSDQDTVGKVLELLNEVLSAVTQRLNDARLTEVAAQSSWDSYSAQLQDLVTNLNTQLDETKQQLAETESQIEQAQEDLDTESGNVQLWTQSLEDERVRYENLSEIHVNTVYNLSDIVTTLQQARDVVGQALTPDYLYNSAEGNQ